MMLGYVLLCLVFFLPIEGASTTLNQPLIAPNEQKSYKLVTISIENHAYHRTLLLVRGYTRQHAPRYVVHGLKKLIADYAYEAPVLTGGASNLRKHKWGVCIVVSFCTSLIVGITVVGCTFYPDIALNTHGGYR